MLERMDMRENVLNAGIQLRDSLEASGCKKPFVWITWGDDEDKDDNVDYVTAFPDQWSLDDVARRLMQFGYSATKNTLDEPQDKWK